MVHFFAMEAQISFGDYQESGLLTGSVKVDDFHHGYLSERLEVQLSDAFFTVFYLEEAYARLLRLVVQETTSCFQVAFIVAFQPYPTS